MVPGAVAPLVTPSEGEARGLLFVKRLVRDARNDRAVRVLAPLVQEVADGPLDLALDLGVRSIDRALVSAVHHRRVERLPKLKVKTVRPPAACKQSEQKEMPQQFMKTADTNRDSIAPEDDEEL